MPPAVPRRVIATLAAWLLLLNAPIRTQDEIRALWVTTSVVRDIGASGVIFFSYDSLADSAHGPDSVAQVGRAAFRF
jgi:hypothetical protein